MSRAETQPCLTRYSTSFQLNVHLFGECDQSLGYIYDSDLGCWQPELVGEHTSQCFVEKYPFALRVVGKFDHVETVVGTPD